jgi:hypothetical protein
MIKFLVFLTSVEKNLKSDIPAGYDKIGCHMQPRSRKFATPDVGEDPLI